MSFDSGFPSVTTTSGRKLRLHEVMLYPEQMVREIIALKQQATKAVGGTSTSIGFFGSPDWVLGAGLAMTILQAIVSDLKETAASKLLSKAHETSLQFEKSGKWFPFSSVANTEYPHPNVWHAAENELVFVDAPEGASQRQLRKQLGLPDLSEKIEQRIERRFIHSGDDFVTLHTDVGIVNLRWSHITTYSRL